MYGVLEVNWEQYQIVVARDDDYDPKSVDNIHDYERTYFLDEDALVYKSRRRALTAKLGDSIIHSCIVIGGHGESGIFDGFGGTVLLHGDSCLVAVGGFICSVQLPSLELKWHTESDWATCFGIYQSEKHQCFVSKGEVAIARVEYDGKVAWSSHGKDIFTGVADLHEDYFYVNDFDDETYKFDVVTGKSEILAPKDIPKAFSDLFAPRPTKP